MKFTKEQRRGLVKEELLKEVAVASESPSREMLVETEDKILDMLELTQELKGRLDELGKQYGEMAGMSYALLSVEKSIDKMYEKYDVAMQNMKKYRT